MKTEKLRLAEVRGLADKIIQVGDIVFDVAEKVPGIDWAAKLGRMSLSDNKHIRALQIVGAAVGLTWGPLAIYNLLKNVFGGGKESDNAKVMIEKQLMGALKKAQEAKTTQMQTPKPQQPQLPPTATPSAQMPGQAPSQTPQPAARAASFPVVKSPKLRARLIRVALSVQILEAVGGSGILEDVGKMVAPRTTENIKEMVAEDESEDEDEDEEASDMLVKEMVADSEDVVGPREDDESYPAGPRNDAKNTRYHVEPAHGQGTVDLLRFTANIDSLVGRIEMVANG